MKLYNTFNQLILEVASRDQIFNAIRDRRVCVIYYEGDETINPGRRSIEPYVLGLSPRENLILRAYQYAGVTDTEQPGWKTFRLDRIRDWQELGRTFNTPISSRIPNIPKYNPNGDRSMITIFKQAKF